MRGFVDAKKGRLSCLDGISCANEHVCEVLGSCDKG